MIFYNHPIINAIVEEPLLDEDELHELSGIESKEEFEKEMKRLHAEGHLEIFPGEINLRANYLSTYYKGFLIDTFDVPYTSEEELARLLEWDTSVAVNDDESFGFNLFIAEIAIIAKYKTAIEQLCSIELDLKRYSYYLHAKWEDVRFPDSYDSQKGITIVHVDDHPLFSSAMEKAVKEKYFPESNWFHFSDTAEALDFIRHQIEVNKTISLIITDLTPYGIHGYEFANSVRRLETESDEYIPIVVMSMLEAEHPTIKLGLEDKTFTRYFHKSEDIRYFGAKLKALLTTNKLGGAGYLNERL